MNPLIARRPALVLAGLISLAAICNVRSPNRASSEPLDSRAAASLSPSHKSQSFAISDASAPYHFDVWTTDNGLPQNSVSSILQTRDGFLWLATNDGLVRYDGVHFSVFNAGNTPGLRSSRFSQLFEDRHG